MGKLSKMLGKALLVGILCLSTVAQGSYRTYGQEENRINYALKGSASADKSPIDYWGPDKLVDEIINRDASKASQSRWSNEARAPSGVMIDLKDVVAFYQIKIAWEKQNVRKYHVELSNDQSSWKNIYSSNDAEAGHLQDSDIKLGHKEYGRYVKITVDALIGGSKCVAL